MVVRLPQGPVGWPSSPSTRKGPCRARSAEQAVRQLARPANVRALGDAGLPRPAPKWRPNAPLQLGPRLASDAPNVSRARLIRHSTFYRQSGVSANPAQRERSAPACATGPVRRSRSRSLWAGRSRKQAQGGSPNCNLKRKVVLEFVRVGGSIDEDRVPCLQARQYAASARGEPFRKRIGEYIDESRSE